MSDLFSMASKLGFSTIFRIVLPGLAWALLLLPIVNPLLPPMLVIDEIVDLATILLPELLVLGLFSSLLSNIIYRIYEGRLLWPQWLHIRLTRNMHKRVGKRLAETKKQDRSSAKYKELWYWLRMFPLDDNGDPIAKRPTILGNVLEGYEEYPERRYGMDAIFYWYRLMPKLPESFLKQMDQYWAEADCMIYSSFAGLVIGLVYSILAIVKWILSSAINLGDVISTTNLNTLNSVPAVGSSLGWAIGCFIGGYIVYRFSIPLHRRNGEYFKATFDVYRGSIIEISKISPEEKEAWQKAWAYLQYMYIQCPNCKKYYYAEADQCPHCLGNESP
jgi:hypothetical protein